MMRSNVALIERVVGRCLPPERIGRSLLRQLLGGRRAAVGAVRAEVVVKVFRLGSARAVLNGLHLVSFPLVLGPIP